MNDLQRLSQYVGEEFSYNNLECCLLDEEEAYTEIDQHKEVTSNFEGYGICSLYSVYYDIPDTKFYNVWVSRNNIIADIKEC